MPDVHGTNRKDTAGKITSLSETFVKDSKLFTALVTTVLLSGVSRRFFSYVLVLCPGASKGTQKDVDPTDSHSKDLDAK